MHTHQAIWKTIWSIKMSEDTSNRRLSDHEGALLDLVRRTEPVTAYRIVKIFDLSPVAAFNTSLGQVYPTIKRLAKAGLVEGVAVEDDARGTAKWRCTDKGVAALREWVLDIKSSHVGSGTEVPGRVTNVAL